MKIMIRILNLDLSGLKNIKPNFDDPEYIMKGTSKVWINLNVLDYT